MRLMILGELLLQPSKHLGRATRESVESTQSNTHETHSYRKRGLPVGPGVVECVFKNIVGSQFKLAGCRWSKADAASNACVGPTSLFGELVVLQPSAES